MYVCCPLARRTDVVTLTEVPSSIRKAKALNALVEISSMSSIITFSLITPAVAATLSMYPCSAAMNAFLDMGKTTRITISTDFEQEVRPLFSWYPALTMIRRALY